MLSVVQRVLAVAAISAALAFSAFAQSADLVVSKTGPNSADANTDVPYTVTILNAGPDAAQTVNLSDTIPPGMTFVSASQTSGPAFNCAPLPAVGGSGTINCGIALLAAGSSANFTFTFHIPTGTANGTAFTNTATASASLPPDPNNGNNASSAVTTLPPPSADLGVSKSGPDTADANTDVAYTVTILNTGPDTSQFVNLDDTIPGGMTFVSAAQNSGPAFDCTPLPAVGGTGTMSCRIDNFAAGSSSVFTFVFHIPTGTAPGTTFVNLATASAELPLDPNSENDTAVAVTTVSPPPQADVSVTKSGPAGAGPGTDVTYTITIVNPSANSATNLSVQDTLPGPMTFVSLNQTSGPPLSCVGGATSTCTSPAFPTGSATLTLVGHIPPATPSGTTFSNTATVTSTNDPNSENNASTVFTTVATTDVSVAKTGPATAAAGSNVTYTITIANAGPDSADNVTLTDTLPAGTTFVSFVQNNGPIPACSLPPLGSGGTLSCNFATLSNGASAQFSLVVKAGTSPSISNTASTTTDSFDSNGTNNSSTVPTTVIPSADLTITKTGPANAAAGSNIVYTILLNNNGPSPSQNVSVGDAVPANTTFVSFTAPAGWTTTSPAVGGTGTVTAFNALVASGASATFTLVVNVNVATAVGTVTSNTVFATPATFDPATPNTSTSNTTVTAAMADLSVTKTANPPVAPMNANVTFTITVTNLGPSNATGVTLIDTVPANMTFVSATPSQGTCSGTGPVNCNLGNLNSGSNAVVTVVARTGDNVGGLTSNTATVSSATPDPNPANNTATATFVAVIPTLSHLILGLLAAVLAAAALLKLK